MLLSFGVSNYYSFKDFVYIDLRPNNSMSTKMNNIQNTAVPVLKTAIIFGGNSSGKSNFYNAFADFRALILENRKTSVGSKIDLGDAFLLDKTSKDKYTEFEIEFEIGSFEYFYSLSLDKEGVNTENLIKRFPGTQKKEIELFTRKGTEITLKGEFLELEITKNKPRDNIIYISMLGNIDSTGETLATDIHKFLQNIIIESNRCPCCNQKDHCRFPEKMSTTELLNEKDMQQKVKSVMGQIGLNIGDIIVKEGHRKHPTFPIRTYTDDMVYFSRPVYDENNNIIGSHDFSLDSHESSGTRAFFENIGPILHTMKYGGILMLDEIDKSRHLLLTQALIAYIHENHEYTANYQIIMSTHSLELLDLDNIFRKDQIWFIEKDQYGASTMYSLDDFKEIQIRNNSNLVKAYKAGMFGGIPSIYGINTKNG